MPTCSQRAQLSRRCLSSIYSTFYLTPRNIITQLSAVWNESYLARTTCLNRWPNQHITMMQPKHDILGVIILRMPKEKDDLINTFLPYISLLSNNPSHNPVFDIKVGMVSEGRVEFFTEQSCYFCLVQSILAGVGGSMKQCPHLALDRIMDWPTRCGEIQCLLPMKRDKTKLWWLEEQPAASISCLSGIDFLKVTAQTSPIVDRPFWLLPSNSRWPVPAQADKHNYHSNSFWMMNLLFSKSLINRTSRDNLTCIRGIYKATCENTVQQWERRM